MTGPFESAAYGILSAGYSALPLPEKAKAYPPAGYTGHHGADASGADVAEWIAAGKGSGNVAARLPATVLGIDVDHYGDKTGADTLARAETQHGALPATVVVYNRDGLSGIRLYRVPPGAYREQPFADLGGSIEVISRSHRYVTAPPSVHPEGRVYLARDERTGEIADTMPAVATLPELPAAWVAFLSAPERADTGPAAAMDDAEVTAFLDGLPAGPPCARIKAAAYPLLELPWAKDLHNSARGPIAAVLRLGDHGHTGAQGALERGRQVFIVAAQDSKRKNARTKSEAEAEWHRMLTGDLCRSIMANPTPANWRTCDCAGAQDEPTPATESPEGARPRFLGGGAFLADLGQTVPPLWGTGAETLWAEGEPLLLTGPTGVGKTTLGAQVIAGRMGLLPSVLDYPVKPGRRVLYLASDRPRQIARALRRLLPGLADSDTLDARLTVWAGPPESDLSRNPGMLLSLALEADADTVVIDSLKDVAAGLSDEETGQGINRAMQLCVANGVEVLAYHHQRKAGSGGGGKPNSLADVYGSSWITAGAGSVVCLWGAAGDPVVELIHLKQPADVVGPLRVEHDHGAGRSTVHHRRNLLDVLRARGSATATMLAGELYGSASDADLRRVRREIKKLESAGRIERVASAVRGGAGAGASGVAYRAVAEWPEGATGHDVATGQATGHAPNGQRPDKRPARPDTFTVSAGQATGQATGATGHVATGHNPPSLKRGVVRSLQDEAEEHPGIAALIDLGASRASSEEAAR